MAKREYIEANKEWLAAKAKEDGVKALHMVAERLSLKLNC